MTNRNDLKRSKMMTDLGVTEGNVTDLTLKWLQQQPGVTSGNINDAWAEYNITQSAPGNINDGFFKWLGFHDQPWMDTPNRSAPSASQFA